MRSWPAESLPALPRFDVDLTAYDTSTGEVKPLAPGRKARMYVCGITPYDATHIGHAATYVLFDIVHRFWLATGRSVRYVQNVTDVDDPLLERAAQMGVDWRELAAFEIQRFRDDMVALRVLPPTHLIGAVETIGQAADRVAQLRDAGATYLVDDDMYFSAAAAARFGQVGHLSDEAMLALSERRGGDPHRPGKRNPIDPLLWQAPRPGEPSWESPLGPGRPGWHIECATIALDLLGPGFDVQGGGRDLVFPHHEMSAAQGEVLEGWPFARTYLHGPMVSYEGQKMSKSLGNLVFISVLRESGVDPMAIRLALLSQSYRSDWEWADDLLTTAAERLRTWRTALSRPTGPGSQHAVAELARAVAEDLDTPQALSIVDDWAREQHLRGGEDPSGPGLMSRAIDAFLGVV
ncbi:MAG TPA: cysteine--1-D-myo-inosityl 2-amino-2-deoxy-alpha-D-glucopyranoside ligase [Actinomycetota bacterium]|nr:cysteine--1-D-myo-inosityl 2-amino-2-deoxy-alpha-D-glucopyranoside ligase [Actinomycetota bacterium]